MIVGIIRDGDDAQLRIVNCGTKDGLGIAHAEGRLGSEIGAWEARRGVIDEHQVISAASGEISPVRATNGVGVLTCATR